MSEIGTPATAAERAALAEAIFSAFRERGEGSDDVAEGADVALDAVRTGDAAAIDALLRYAATAPGLLGEVRKRLTLETA